MKPVSMNFPWYRAWVETRKDGQPEDSRLDWRLTDALLKGEFPNQWLNVDLIHGTSTLLATCVCVRVCACVCCFKNMEGLVVGA